MSKRIRLGILTPSSNTALEPLTQAMLAPLPHITVHFSRFPVTTISLSPTALSQFQTSRIVAAAKLLADARVDIIGWSGTSSGWLGFNADERLCEEITAATGIPATTSVLALNKLLTLLRVERLGLVTPYLDHVQEAIIRNYSSVAVNVCAESHLGIVENTAIADVDETTLDRSVESVVASGKVQAVTTFCTNLVAAQRVVYWEAKHHVPVFDTVTTVVWDMLRQTGQDTETLIAKWGRIFAI